MDQGTTPKASIIGLLGKKKKPGEVNDTGLQGFQMTRRLRASEPPRF
jgi:hypothetical protein